MKKKSKTLDKILQECPRDFNIKLWNGHVVEYCGHPRFTIVFKDKETFKKIFTSGSTFFIWRSYLENKFEIEGDLNAAADLKKYLTELKVDKEEMSRLMEELS